MIHRGVDRKHVELILLLIFCKKNKRLIFINISCTHGHCCPHQVVSQTATHQEQYHEGGRQVPKCIEVDNYLFPLTFAFSVLRNIANYVSWDERIFKPNYLI